MINALAQTLAILVLVAVVYAIWLGMQWAFGTLRKGTVPLAEHVALKEENRQLRVRLDKEVERGVNQGHEIQRLQRLRSSENLEHFPSPGPANVLRERVDDAVREVMEKQDD